MSSNDNIDTNNSEKAVTAATSGDGVEDDNQQSNTATVKMEDVSMEDEAKMDFAVSSSMEDVPFQEGNLDDSRQVFNDTIVPDEELAVHKDGIGSSLPTADQILRNNTSSSRRWVKFVLAFLIAFGVLFGIAIGINRKRSKDSTFEGGRKTSLGHVVNFLLDENISSLANLEDTDSPQYRAAEWLAKNDEANLPIPKNSDISHLDGYRYMARYIMAVLYYTTEGNGWNSNLDFLSEKDICDWKGHVAGPPNLMKAGVFCDAQTLLPLYLDIYGNSLKGSIPTEVGLLTTLYSLDLEQNNITSTIPMELCKLTELRSLSLGWNDLGFSVPGCIGNLGNLQFLHLNNNDFTGEIPTEFSQLTLLEHLFVDDNEFDADPSPIFNKLSNLQILMAEKNEFEIILDETFLENHDVLEWLDLSDNNLMTKDNKGLPSNLFSLSKLEVLDLSANRLAGSIPTTIEQNTVLLFFSASTNFLNGGIPSALENLMNLHHLDVSDNLFHGPIPEALGNLERLRLLYLGDNEELHHNSDIPESFLNLTSLEDLNLRRTARHGELPEFLGSLKKLVYLDLGSNHWHGEIPDTYGENWKNMEFFMVNHNPNITGSLPNNFKNMEKLRGIFIDGTGIEENVDDIICSLPNFINMDGNEIAFADCGGVSPSFTCSCCQCCDNEDIAGCSIPFQKELRNSWLKDFESLQFEVHNGTAFLNRDYIPPVNS